MSPGADVLVGTSSADLRLPAGDRTAQRSSLLAVVDDLEHPGLEVDAGKTSTGTGQPIQGIIHSRTVHDRLADDEPYPRSPAVPASERIAGTPATSESTR